MLARHALLCFDDVALVQPACQGGVIPFASEAEGRTDHNQSLSLQGSEPRAKIVIGPRATGRGRYAAAFRVVSWKAEPAEHERRSGP